MSAFKGRTVTFTWNDIEIPGVREKTIQLNGEPIDITSDENLGWRTLLDATAQDEVTISLTGVTKDRTLMGDWFDGNRTRTASLEYPDGSTISGTFFLANYQDRGAYNDAVAFTAEVRSTGAVTYTPGS